MRAASILLATGIAAVLSTSAVAATSTHALTVSGQARGGVPPFGCATSGPTPAIRARFGTGVGVPTEGHAACGLAGGIAGDAKVSGPSASVSSASSVVNGGTNTGYAEARALEGDLGVVATQSYVGGALDGSTFLGSEAAAIWSDTLDYGGSGLGYVQWSYQIDGGMSLTGPGGGFLYTYLNYQINSGPIYTMFLAELLTGASPRVIAPATDGPLSGYIVGPTSISGSTLVTTYRDEVDLSKPFTISFGLYTSAYGRPNGSAANDFLHTAKLSGVSVQDRTGQELHSRFVGKSGVVYDSTGAHAPSAVPEPQAWFFLLTGFACVGAGLRQRPQRRLQGKGLSRSGVAEASRQ